MNKNKVESQEHCRQVRREMARHSVNCGEVEVTVTHGTIHLHGRVRPLRGHEAKFDAEILALLKALRQCPGIRAVYTEWTQSG